MHGFFIYEFFFEEAKKKKLLNSHAHHFALNSIVKCTTLPEMMQQLINVPKFLYFKLQIQNPKPHYY